MYNVCAEIYIEREREFEFCWYFRDGFFHNNKLQDLILIPVAPRCCYLFGQPEIKSHGISGNRSVVDRYDMLGLFDGQVTHSYCSLFIFRRPFVYAGVFIQYCRFFIRAPKRSTAICSNSTLEKYMQVTNPARWGIEKRGPEIKKHKQRPHTIDLIRYSSGTPAH